ncbi:MAG TPA: flagellar hook-basal body complex protein FliE [Chloroflexota bacterium]|nr:flagellar hook-basal body complex protein FliE [Chloroflexota bacterium]HZT96784.1 flagellar hook-basal body complex protein FliE [Chloroflexota bacterium]
MDPLSGLSPITASSDLLVNSGQNQATGTADGALQPNGSVSAATGFGQMLTNAVGGLSGLQQNADNAVAGLALHQGVDIHQAMLAMDQASLGMSFAIQVRDKAVEAYQTLLNMQM